LRAKLRHERKDRGGKAIDQQQLYEKAKAMQEDQLRDISRRNAQIRRAHDMEKKGVNVNHTLFDEEALIIKHMR